MEIVRKDELEHLLDAINENPYGKFIISGIAGSGKTFLLNVLGNILQDSGKNVVYGGTVAFSQVHVKDLTKVVYLIDGLDEIYRHRQIVEEIRNGRGCYICTARENIFDIRFDYELKLKSLTTEQALLLVNDYFGTYISVESAIGDFFRRIDKECITPRNLIEEILVILKSKGIDEYFLNLEAGSHQLYTYGKGISLSHPKIIIPKRNSIKVPDEIKNDINAVTRSLLDKVVLNPEMLFEITPRQFEELVCELFEKKGYNVKLTKQTRDGGKDIIILNNSILGDLLIYAECKKFAPKHPVNVGLVKELYATVEADRATAGIMVTTSYFSRDARRFQEKIKGRMNFIDYSELMRQILECK